MAYIYVVRSKCNICVYFTYIFFFHLFIPSASQQHSDYNIHTIIRTVYVVWYIRNIDISFIWFWWYHGVPETLLIEFFFANSFSLLFIIHGHHTKWYRQKLARRIGRILKNRWKSKFTTSGNTFQADLLQIGVVFSIRGFYLERHLQYLSN